MKRKKEITLSKALVNFIKDRAVSETMVTEEFYTVIDRFDNNPDAAKAFIEMCERMDFKAICDDPEASWRDLPDKEISGLAKVMATCLRNMYFLN